MTDFDNTIPDPPEDLSLDSLADVPVDESEVAQATKDALPKAGWYTTEPEGATLKVGKAEASGRPYGRFFGKAVGPEDARLGFGFSWERRNRIVDGVDTGKPDQMYVNYTRLVAMYKASQEVAPSKVQDILTFLASVPIQMRIVPNRDGTDYFVVGLKLPGERG